MFTQHERLLAEADDGTGQGGGAPDGGSPKDEHGQQPKGEEFVPKTQFLAALHSANEKYSTLEAEFRRLQEVQAKKAELPKRYSRVELKAAVEAGQISQDDADSVIERQIREDAVAEAKGAALQAVSSASRKDRVDSEIARYKAAAPEIMDDGHETRQRIREEFSALLELGDDPKDVSTQLKAIRAVLGPVDRLERSRSGKHSTEPSRESGSEGAPEDRKPKTGKLVDQLRKEVKETYADEIKKGRYKDWADVEKTLSYASPGVRRRLGIAT